MTNLKRTKKALLSSVLSLLLCFSMLLGTTYAWFTDSVSSANNIITAGNLDVELKYYDGSAWVDVTSETNVFRNDTLWEPGHTEVVYLQVNNAGTLALKYNLAINVASETAGINKEGKLFKLSNYIEYQVVDLAVNEDTFQKYADRNAALAAVTSPAKLASAYSKSSFIKAGDDAHFVALIVNMPESVGNDVNYKTGTNPPVINLGIRLFATQYTAENDSFDFTYDAGAPWTGAVDTSWYTANSTATEFVIKTPEALAGLAEIVNAGTDTFAGNTVKLGDDIDLNNLPWTPIGTNAGWAHKFSGSFYGNGYTISNLYVTGTTGVGLFGYVGNTAHLEGITIDGAYVAGNDYVGAVMGSGYLAANCLLNCTVIDATVIATPYLKADGVTYDGGAKAGAVAGYAINGNISGNKAIGCSVSAYRDLGGIVGMAQGADRPITVSKNEVDGVKLSYVTVVGKYADNKPNENMADVVGRVSNATVADDNVVKGESQKDETLSFVVSNDAELAAVLSMIKTTEGLWNREVEVILNEYNYSADHVIYQYPQWNGIVGAGTTANNYASGVTDAPYTLLTFKGINAVFTGNVTVKGFGNAGAGFPTATAKTTFEGITFDGAKSVESNGEDYIVAYVVAAANDVTFDTCTFKNATHVTLGGSASDAVGAVNVVDCTFNDGGCLSGYVETLNVSGTNVTAAKNGFINKSKAGTVTVEDCNITAGKYFLRTATGGSGVKLNVKNSTVTMYESEDAKDLVKFRGGNESAEFIDCNIADGYTTAGVDADSTLTIYNYTQTDDGLTLLKDGVSNEVTLYLVPSDYEGTTVTVPEGVDFIGNYAFAYNSNVKEVTLASTVRDLGRGFDGSTVEKVVLNEGLTTISSRAFRSTPSLKEVVISSTVTTIADNAFQKSGIKTLTIPANVKTIGETAFGASQIETVIIEGDTNIEGYAFRGCSKLHTVYLNGLNVNFVPSALNGRNSMWFCNGESNNPNTSNITFYVKNEVIKEKVLTAMGAERNNTPVICEQTPATDENGESLGYYVDDQGTAFTYDAKGLDAALNDDSLSTIVLSGDLNFNSSETSANSGYGATGVSVKGGVLDGNGNSLGINNWGTWDAAVHTTGGTIKNLIVNSGMRGIFMGSATGDVYIDNVIIDGTIYTFNSDGGSKDYGVYISNSTLNGWTSFSDVHKEVVFDNCSFGEGEGYAFCRPYNSTTKFKNCVFAEGFKFDTSKTSDITFENCYYGDTPITAENAASLKNGSTIFFYNGLNSITINGKKAINASSSTELNTALGTPNSNVSVTLNTGNYTLPSASGSDVSISGTKDTVITVDRPNYSGSDVTFNGVTVKGSGYSTGVQHVNTVTYNGATIVGEMCLYGEKVVFNGCTFELNGQYIWTYGAKEVEFNNCTFNTTGKAILIYNEGAGASKVTVKGCTFNATAGAKAGAIANQNCAAIEIDNFQTSGTGTAHTLITEGNTYSSNFSGEWRIKNYVNGGKITVNGTEYTSIALDGKLMTIDSGNNVTVID